MLKEWINLRPWQTVKSQEQYQKRHTYTFLVNPHATRLQIKVVLKEIFPGIKIQKIRTTTRKPVLQKKTLRQKLNKKIYTKTKKKVFVQLHPGYSLPLFKTTE